MKAGNQTLYFRCRNFSAVLPSIYFGSRLNNEAIQRLGYSPRTNRSIKFGDCYSHGQTFCTAPASANSLTFHFSFRLTQYFFYYYAQIYHLFYSGPNF